MSIQTKQPLTLKYRPQRFSDVYEQDAVKQILQYELQTGNIKRCLLFTGPAGCGKCLAKGTQILMHDNTIKNVEDILVGDLLMGPDNKSRIVTSLANGKELMYKVLLEDGSYFSCNKSHIITLKHNQTQQIEHFNVEDVYNNPQKYKDYYAIKYQDDKLYKFSIEKLHVDQYYGFIIEGDYDSQIENIDKCFVLANGIITHNTTSARIFAKEIESTVSNIIEINCADHTGIDDARQLIIEPSKSKPLVGAYKIFILDEVHMLTVQSQNALLKLFEEPPSFCIYIMCTTDPQKVLSTILSRCFRYDFQLISHQGIVNRLNYILTQEQQDPNGCGVQSWNMDALNFIALHSKGHMRNSIVTLEKSLAFDKHLTIQNVEKVLGVTGFEDMFKVLDSILNKQQDILLQSLDNIEKSGIDLKLFIKNFLQFVLDINKYIILKTECPNTLVQFTMIPPSYENRLQQYNVAHRQALKQLLQLLLQLNSLVRWETNVKPVLETNLLLEIL